jgi:hypothetical protein
MRLRQHERERGMVEAQPYKRLKTKEKKSFYSHRCGLIS